MSEKVVILVEDDFFKTEDMLLSLQSILFVAAKQKSYQASEKDDIEICLLHVLGDDGKEDSKTFERLKSVLEDRQRNYEIELKYKYEAVRMDKKTYPENLDECAKTLSDKIREIVQKREYSILLDVILVRTDSKDPDQIMRGENILSQLLYNEFSEHCIPYTTYDISGKTFRTKWAEMIGGKIPYERFRLDGNVIYKDFKQELYRQLKINV